MASKSIADIDSILQKLLGVLSSEMYPTCFCGPSIQAKPSHVFLHDELLPSLILLELWKQNGLDQIGSGFLLEHRNYKYIPNQSTVALIKKRVSIVLIKHAQSKC
jgi:hypothetical protein